MGLHVHRVIRDLFQPQMADVVARELRCYSHFPSLCGLLACMAWYGRNRISRQRSRSQAGTLTLVLGPRKNLHRDFAHVGVRAPRPGILATPPRMGWIDRAHSPPSFRNL